MTKYVSVSYKPDGPRYTYVTEEDINPGDQVTFTTRHGGEMTREALDVTDEAPKGYVCQPCWKA